MGGRRGERGHGAGERECRMGAAAESAATSVTTMRCPQLRRRRSSARRRRGTAEEEDRRGRWEEDTRDGGGWSEGNGGGAVGSRASKQRWGHPATGGGSGAGGSRLPRERGALGVAAGHASSRGSVLGFCVKKKEGRGRDARRGTNRARAATHPDAPGGSARRTNFFAIPHFLGVENTSKMHGRYVNLARHVLWVYKLSK
jgi:hypothetical protein